VTVSGQTWAPINTGHARRPTRCGASAPNPGFRCGPAGGAAVHRLPGRDGPSGSGSLRE